MRARTRLCRVQVRRSWDDPLAVPETILTLFKLGIVTYAFDKVFGRWTDPPMVETHAAIALYAAGRRLWAL
jgi:hypothetical protein